MIWVQPLSKCVPSFNSLGFTVTDKSDENFHLKWLGKDRFMDGQKNRVTGIARPRFQGKL